MATQLIDIGPEPTVINSAERDIGGPGAFVHIVNVGDDGAAWRIAESVPSGPGFPLARGQGIKMSLPAVGNLYAWAGGRTRLAVSPLYGTGVVPTATNEYVATGSAIRLPVPAGFTGEGSSVAIVNVGPNDFFDRVDADGDTAPVLEPGDVGTRPGERLPLRAINSGGESIWVWSPRGTTILTTGDGDDWEWPV